MWKKVFFGALTLLFLASLLMPLARGQSPFDLGLDLAGGAMVTYRPDLESVPERLGEIPEAELLAMAKEALAGRLAQRFETLPDVVIRGDGRLVVSLPGAHDQRQVLETLGQTYRLTFRQALEIHRTAPDSPGESIKFYEGRWLELGPELLDGSMLDPRSIRVQTDAAPESFGQGAVISFEFRPPHDETFARITREGIGKTLAILLDDEVEWAGRVESEIRGPGQLRGGYDFEQAAEVAGLLRSGQLPFSLDVESVSGVGATLGQDMADRGLSALGWSAGVLLLLLALAYAHRPALLLTGWLSLGFLWLTTLGLIALGHLTVDLVALAGLVLSVGMGMDAFILIFEALESRQGRSEAEARSPLGLIKKVYGWTGEGRTLLHANATTLLVVVLLFIPDRLASFALFLCVGLAASLSTLLVTRAVLESFARRGWLESVWLESGSPSSEAAPTTSPARPPVARRWSLLTPLRSKGRSRFGLGKWRIVYVLALTLFFALAGAAWIDGEASLELGSDFNPGLQLRLSTLDGKLEPWIAELEESFPRLESRQQTWDPPQDVTGQGHLVTLAARGGAAEPAALWTPQALAETLEQHGITIHGMESIDAKLSGDRIFKSLAVLIGSFMMLGLYLLYAQPRLDDALAALAPAGDRGVRVFFGTVAAVGLDLLVVLAALALLEIPVGMPVLAAILTIIGYSVNDSMVLWSHLSRHPESAVEEVVDRLLSRTVLTSLSTMVPAAAILIAQLEPLRGFAWAVLVGTLAGTLSSIFVVASFASSGHSARLAPQEKATLADLEATG